MERRIIGIVALIVGGTAILLFSSATVSSIRDSNPIDYIARAFIWSWITFSAFVKIEMVFNKKERLINIGSIILFGCMVFFTLLAGGRASVDTGILTGILGWIFLLGWPIIDLYDLKYLSPTPKERTF